MGEEDTMGVCFKRERFGYQRMKKDPWDIDEALQYLC